MGHEKDREGVTLGSDLGAPGKGMNAPGNIVR